MKVDVSDAVDLDQRLDDLFAGRPDGFVAAREALVKDLKREGRSDDAASVHALRRPTVAVAGINQMARARPDQLAALVAAGADVESRQHSGPDGRDELRAASRRRRALLDELTEVAATLTGRPESTRTNIAATLDAASLDAALQDDLGRGRLTAELATPVRFFGELADDAPGPRSPRVTKRPAPVAPARDELAARRAATALADARTRAEEAEDELRDADTGVRDAQDQLDAAHRRVADLEEALADSRRAVIDAKRQVTEATRVQTRTRAGQRRADAALRVAERRAEEADA